MPSSFVLPLLLGTAFALQPPGQFHGNEPVARDGERWLALRVEGGDAELVATTLRVRAAFDDLLDASGQQTTREVVSGLDDDNVIAFLRGDSLRPGAIERAVVASSPSTSTTLPVYELTFRGQHHRIEARCDPEAFEHVGAQAHFACRIVLDDGARTQTLAEMSGYHEVGATTMSLGDDASPRLLFAGDIDRDGKLDLIFDISDHYNVMRPTLLLSSQAARDALLRVAARYRSVGC